ncbi:hypothetical protein LJR129_002156 [Acidovorax sp. LjRoot129]|uniref:hypothetical protein n=1 Tax=Acidovorax sp. LjRoot129 TaxID=3342260 RepID=UPI003ECC5218
MKRSELYELVWKTPLRHLGPQLGMSDVGLSKLCRRYDIPVPPVGFWTRLAAGKPCLPTPLPPTDVDAVLRLPEKGKTAEQSVDATRLQQVRQTFSRAKNGIAVPPIEIPPSLDNCHPLVARTTRFFQSIEREEQKRARDRERAAGQGRPYFGGITGRHMSMGRYITGEGCLRITATTANIDWILRFHEALLRGLVAGGCHIVASGKDSRNTVEIRRAGGSICLNFAEQAEKIVKPRSKGVFYDPTEYRARDVYKLKLERGWSAIARQWTGTRQQMEKRLPEITQALIAFPEAEALRSKLVAEEAAMRAKAQQEADLARRIAAAAEEARAKRREARTSQLPRALAVGEALGDYHRVLDMLSRLEVIAGDKSEEEALHTWIALVRDSLKDPVHGLADALRAEGAALDRPLWWPG